LRFGCTIIGNKYISKDISGGMLKMSRGLSELQKSMMMLADAKYNGSKTIDKTVFTSEVCIEVYGWKPEYPIDRGSPGSHRFDKQKIGKKTYVSVHVAISKAVNRLEKRGFINVWEGAISHWTGFSLTAKGKDVVDLLGNSKVKSPLS
jgi:hypothetical protein